MAETITVKGDNIALDLLLWRRFGVRGQQLVEETYQLNPGLADLGLILPPGPRFTTGGVLERRLRIPITLPPERTAEAMGRLSQAWQDVRGGTASRAEELRHAAVI